MRRHVVADKTVNPIAGSSDSELRCTESIRVDGKCGQWFIVGVVDLLDLVGHLGLVDRLVLHG